MSEPLTPQEWIEQSYPGPTREGTEVVVTDDLWDVDDAQLWHAAHLAGVCEERGRILDLLAHHAAHEYHGGWIRRLIEAIEAGTPAPPAV